jgi:hypothetical protein
MIQFNMTSGVWSKLDASGYSADQTVHRGMGAWLPSIGAGGLAVFFGGQTSNNVQWFGNEPLIPLDNIALYDPVAQNGYHQPTTGQIPEARTSACAVGVPGSNGTYEM